MLLKITWKIFPKPQYTRPILVEWPCSQSFAHSVVTWTVDMMKFRLKLDDSSKNSVSFCGVLLLRMRPHGGWRRRKGQRTHKKDALINQGRECGKPSKHLQVNIYMQISLGSFWKEERGNLDVQVRFRCKRQGRAPCAGRGGACSWSRVCVPESYDQKFPCLPFLACSIIFFLSQNNSALWLSYQDVPSWFCSQCFPS